jgi:hypothetical protein
MQIKWLNGTGRLPPDLHINDIMPILLIQPDYIILIHSRHHQDNLIIIDKL